MKCKKCKRDLPDNSIFCCWCGEKQLKQKDAVTVPKPTKLKNGSYSAQIMVDGQRVRVTGKTEAEYAKNARAAKERLIEISTNPKISAEAGIDKYIESRSEVLSASTIRGYKFLQKAIPKVDDIAAADWQNIINDMVKDEYSPKTVKNAWRLMSSVLRYYDLKVPSVVLPQIIPHERPFLQPEEINDYIKAIAGQPCEIPALLALNSLRQSEILGLTWNDIDMERNTISVNGAVVFNADNKLIRKRKQKMSPHAGLFQLSLRSLSPFLKPYRKQSEQAPL